MNTKMDTEKTKHTPGPWSHTPMQDTIWANEGETKIASIADLPWKENPVTGKRSSDFDTEQANARLIAAAPELFEALQSSLAYMERDSDDEQERDDYAAAQAAIAKATNP